jgi:hypothetical protein
MWDKRFQVIFTAIGQKKVSLATNDREISNFLEKDTSQAFFF